MSEANKQILRDYTRKALIEGNLDAIPKYIAPEYIHHLPSGDDLVGIDGMREAVIAYRNTFKDIDIEIHDMVGEGDRVATRLTVSGTHAGEFLGVPATGKRINRASDDAATLSIAKELEKQRQDAVRRI